MVSILHTMPYFQEHGLCMMGSQTQNSRFHVAKYHPLYHITTGRAVFQLVNTGRERAKVSLVLTWANSIGGISHLSGDHVNEPFIGEDGVAGVLLDHRTAKDNPPVTFAIAACETQNVNVTVLPNFGLSRENYVTTKNMWDTMVQVLVLWHTAVILMRYSTFFLHFFNMLFSFHSLTISLVPSVLISFRTLQES